MRQLFKTLAAVALVAFAAVSCQKELTGVFEPGTEAEVNFSIGTPVLGTKAFADGNTVDVVRCVVYSHDADDNLSLISSNTITKDVEMTAGKATYSTRLLNGQKYTFIFWAEKDGNGAYTLDMNSKTVSVSYENAVSGTEGRDAFYAVLPAVTINGPYNASVTLYRPFAQLNFGVTEEDWNAAVAAGFTASTAAVMLSSVGNSLSLLDGTVTGDANAEFSAAELPSETLTVDGVGYKYVAMNYVLVGKDAKSLADVTLSVSADGTQTSTYTYTNVPLQGNYRTNIVGNLFTSPTEVQIVVDPGFAGEYKYPELLAAAQNGGEVTLTEDVVLDETLEIAAGKTMVLDLGGKTISNNDDIWDPSLNNWSLLSVRGGTLIIKGAGNVTAKENDCYAVDVQDGGKVIIEDGNYVGNIHAVYVHEGEAEIKGGTYDILQQRDTYPYEFILNCYDDSYKAGKASISVSGGEFYHFNPGDCRAEGAGTSFLAEGYTSVKISDDPAPNGTFRVVPAYGKVSSADELYEAISNGGDIIVVSDIILGKDIDLNGYDLTLCGDIFVNNDNCTISGGNIYCMSEESADPSLRVKSNGILVIDDCIVVSSGSPIIVSDEASLTIKNSEIRAGVYGIATNASYSTQNPTIVLENVSLSGSDPVFVNIPCSLTMKNCNVSATMHGVVVRGGTADISDCVIELDYPDSDAEDMANFFVSRNWGSGNMINLAAMTIGNKSPNAYQYPTKVSMKNTQLNVVGEYAQYFPCLYAWANEGENGVTLTYENCTFTGGTGIIYGSENITVNGEPVTQTP